MSAHSKIYYLSCSVLVLLALVMLAGCGDNAGAVAPIAAATTGVTPTPVAATSTTAPTVAKATATTAVTATTPATAASTTAAGSNSSSDTLDPAKVENGHKVFVTQCQVCHLNGGKSSGGVGPNLAFSRKATDPVKVRTNIRNGVDAMPAFDTTKISDTELENIVLYLKSIHQS